MNLVTANQSLPHGIGGVYLVGLEVQTQLSGKTKHTHYREVLFIVLKRIVL